VVKGPVVTRRYLARPEENARTKIPEGDEIWHRMGDLGYLDGDGRLWFCGRKSHRVETAQGLLLAVPCEAVFDRHLDVARAALVGVGERPRQRPVLVVEPRPGRRPASRAARRRFVAELRALGARDPRTRGIRDALFHPGLPLDVRHNAKIRREVLAGWAAWRLAG
jgi:acyl-CoA synthetase (AMP-forming)/AMP-acid ligase II